MLSLDSKRWGELRHAYGPADDIPTVLRQLERVPSSENDIDTWLTLWSALAHQGDVYSASFAAVPHVVHALASVPAKADHSYFQFPAWVEICRAKNHVDIPEDLRRAYFDWLAQMPALVAAVSDRPWDVAFLACTLAAVAAAKGQPAMAEAALELTPEVARDFMHWFHAR